MKYSIRVNRGIDRETGKVIPSVRQAEGKPVVLAGFENYEFFARKDGDCYWIITEMRTGRQVNSAYIHTTRKRAVENAISRLEEHKRGLDQLINRLQLQEA